MKTATFTLNEREVVEIEVLNCHDLLNSYVYEALFEDTGESLTQHELAEFTEKYEGWVVFTAREQDIEDEQEARYFEGMKHTL